MDIEPRRSGFSREALDADEETPDSTPSYTWRPENRSEQSVEMPEQYFLENIGGLANLLLAMRQEQDVKDIGVFLLRCNLRDAAPWI